VQDAIALVFSKFAELQTVRQVLVWFRRERVLLPAIVQGRGKRPIEWKAPETPSTAAPMYTGGAACGDRSRIRCGRRRSKQPGLNVNFDAVAPDNRLVADELERRWNERLAATRALEEDLIGSGPGMGQPRRDYRDEEEDHPFIDQRDHRRPDR